MKLVARKLEVKDAGKMQTLVIENIDGIEADLTVLDSRLLLGNANIEVVALDGRGSLVLIAIALTADEQMLLKAVEAYSWCLEYPDAIRRLYPAAEISAARPPRVMFVVERMPDSFHRKVKQLGFPEVDCVEFRHVSVDGTEAVYFDTLVRLRRAPAAFEPTSAVTAPTRPDGASLNGGNGTRATSMKLQKLLNADTPSPGALRPFERIERNSERPAAPIVAEAPVRESAAVVSMVSRSARIAAGRLEEVVPLPSRPAPQPIVAHTAPAVMEPVARPSVLELESPVEPPAFVVREPALERPPAIAPMFEVSQVGVSKPVVASPAPMRVIAVEPIVVAAAAPTRAAVDIIVPEVASEPFVVPEPVEPPVAAVALEPEPVLETPVLEIATAPVHEMPEPRMSFEDLSRHLLEAQAAAAPIVVEPKPIEVAVAPAAASPEPRLSFADLSKELLEPKTAAAQPRVAATPGPLTESKRIVADAVAATASAALESRLSLADLSKELFAAPGPARAPKAVTPSRLHVPAIGETPVVVAESPNLDDLTRTILEQIETGSVPPPAPAAPSVTPSQPVELPQEFQGMKFPNDGVLTRQWMDFLNQMGATK